MDKGVKFTEEGRRTLHSLHIETQREVKTGLRELGRGARKGKPLTGRLHGFYSLRVGNYRAIYSMEESAIVVHVVGHRRNVYGAAA